MSVLYTEPYVPICRFLSMWSGFQMYILVYPILKIAYLKQTQSWYILPLYCVFSLYSIQYVIHCIGYVSDDIEFNNWNLNIMKLCATAPVRVWKKFWWHWQVDVYTTCIYIMFLAYTFLYTVTYIQFIKVYTCIYKYIQKASLLSRAQGFKFQMWLWYWSWYHRPMILVMIS